MNAYQRAFGARIGCLLRYEDANPSDDDTSALTEREKRLIYHAELFIGEQRVMMADHIGIPFQPGRALFLTLTFDTKEEVRAAFEALKDGCEIITPIHSTTYSSCEVTFVDRFGMRWGLMTEQTDR